VVSDGFFSRNK